MNLSLGLLYIFCLIQHLGLLYLMCLCSFYKIDEKAKYKKQIKSIYKYLLANKKESGN